MNTNPNEPAFPVVAENGLWNVSVGLTKREYFAAAALPACIAAGYLGKAGGKNDKIRI